MKNITGTNDLMKINLLRNTLIFRYSYIYNDGKCICGNYQGEQVTNDTCKECTSCDPPQNFLDIYATGNLGK